MQQMNASEASSKFGSVLMKSQKEPISILKNGKPVAVVISDDEYLSMKEALLRAAIIEGELSGDDGLHNMDDIKREAREELGLPV